mgnify:CR=1 FL=1
MKSISLIHHALILIVISPKMSPFLKIKTNILCQKTLKAIIFAFDLKIIRLYQLITQSEHMALIQIHIQKAG